MVDVFVRRRIGPWAVVMLVFSSVLVVMVPGAAGGGDDTVSAAYVGGNAMPSGMSAGWSCAGGDGHPVVAVMGCELRCPDLECAITLEEMGPRMPGFWSECGDGSQGEWTDGHTRHMPRCVGRDIVVLPGIGATTGEIRLSVI